VRRCYLNPLTVRPHPVSEEVVPFGDFRGFLARGGFDVIDCPPLTQRHKNAADLWLALDAADLLYHRTQFDEFIVFSGDADFTPLLQRLREYDRRAVVVSSDWTAAGYRELAHHYLNSHDLLELVGADDVRASSGPDAAPAGGTGGSGEAPPHGRDADMDLGELREQAVQLAIATVGGSPCAVPLPVIGSVIRAETGGIGDRTNWFGCGGMAGAIAPPAGSDLRMDAQFVWDRVRHKPPRRTQSVSKNVSWTFAHYLHEATGMPVLSSREYVALFEEIAEHVRTNPIEIPALKTAVCEALNHRGMTRSKRAVIGRVLIGIQRGGCALGGAATPTAAELAEAFYRSVVDCDGLVLHEQHRRRLHRWLTGEPERDVAVGG
jgi:hypothetical protein